MWILESNGSSFGGKKKWLRPERKYVFGRTATNASEFVIAHKTVSRKHLTITIDRVDDGAAQQTSSRSRLVFEDLNSSKGTTVADAPLKGKLEFDGTSVEFKMGLSSEIFRLTWTPVVLVCSISTKSSQAETSNSLRSKLEQLDIKFLADFRPHATHVISKKRNTPKGLQALVTGKFLVANSFIDAIVAAAALDPHGTSLLEQDFHAAWPRPVDHVPPKGSEAIDPPATAFLPDASGRRRHMFAGYTFVFYDDAQYKTLLAPLTSAEAKVLICAVDPGSASTTRTAVDDFVHFVKTAAGETGLGEFADGSVGPGVVVVRYIPATGPAMDWYARFITDVCVRLNHRAIEQSEFIEAILMADASILRRPLPAADGPAGGSSMLMRPPEPLSSTPQSAAFPAESFGASVLQDSGASESLASKPRGRQRATRRFKGFDSDDDDDDDGSSQWQSALQSVAPSGFTSAHQSQSQRPVDVVADSEGDDDDDDDCMFVPQGPGYSKSQQDQANAPPARNVPRKRPHQSLIDESLMDDIAPTAAQAKRQRIERGENLIPVKLEPDQPPEISPQGEEEKEHSRQRKTKKEINVLEVARRTREEQEARIKREQEDLTLLPEDLDMLQIRRDHVVKPATLRQRVVAAADDDVDALVAAGRWDAKWNGRKNFKKFRARGEPRARVPAKRIVPLAQVKTKDFGLGDDYWLQDSSAPAAARGQVDGARPEEQEKDTDDEEQKTVARRIGGESDDDDDDDDMPAIGNVQAPPARLQETPGARRKRPYTASVEPPVKRTRAARQPITIPDSDSEEESRFQFGRRR